MTIRPVPSNRARYLSGLSVVGLAALLGATGCRGTTSNDGEEDDDAIASSLELENGGLSDEDEAPAFGDSELLATAGLERTLADETDLAAEETARSPGAKVHRVVLVWGHLPTPRDDSSDDRAPSAADWSGTISIDAGAIGVRRTLRFEGADRIEPRTDRRTVSFSSRTLPHVDGLLLRVAIPDGAPNVLHVQTNSVSVDIDLTVANEGGVAHAGDTGNGLAYYGYEERDGCARGILFGRWIKARPGLGRFQGLVVNEEGERIGYARGIWGRERRSTDRVYFGKAIGVDGESRGLFGGTYGDGRITGMWAAKGPGEVGGGAMAGRYSDGFERGDGRGAFLAGYGEACE